MTDKLNHVVPDVDPIQSASEDQGRHYALGAYDAAKSIRLLVRVNAPLEAINEFVGALRVNYKECFEPDDVRRILLTIVYKYRLFELIEKPEWVDDPTLRIDGTKEFPAYSYQTQQGNKGLKIWCDYCYRWHYHTGGRHFGDTDGLRGAHCCYQDSPYKIDFKGYFIREVGAAPIEDIVDREALRL